MNVEEYVERIYQLWEDDQQVSEAVLQLARDGVEAYPASAEIWCLYGIVIHVWSRDSRFKAGDFVAAFERAIACDPGCAEAYQELGAVLDTYFDDFERAEDCFRSAIALGAGAQSYAGLARVLAQTGRGNDALDLLHRDRCPFADDEQVCQLRAEIEQGLWSPA